MKKETNVKVINELVYKYYELSKFDKETRKKAHKIIKHCNEKGILANSLLEFNYDELITSGIYKPHL